MQTKAKSAFRCWWLQFGNKGVRTGVGTGTAVGEGVELGGDVSGKLEVVLWGEDIGEIGSGGSRQRFKGLVVSFKEPIVVEGREQFEFDPKEAQGGPQRLEDCIGAGPYTFDYVGEGVVGCCNDCEDGLARFFLVHLERLACL